MKSKWHIIISTSTTLFLVLILRLPITISTISVILGYYASRFPDYDTVTGGHRDMYAHSVLPHFLYLGIIFIVQSDALIFLWAIPFSVGVHLLCDLRFPGHWKGTYLLKFWPHRRLSGISSTIWLIVHGILGITAGLLIVFN